MKLGQSVPGAKGSFGVPPELKAEGDRMMVSAAKDDSERPSMDGYEEPQEHKKKLQQMTMSWQKRQARSQPNRPMTH